MSVLGFHSCSEFVVYVTFLFFGLSVMMVSNAITAAPSFITEYYKYASGSPDTKPLDPDFWANILTYYNVAVFGMQVVCEVFMLTPLGRSIPLRPRLIVGLIIPFIELLALILVPVGKTSEGGAKATIMVIAIVGGLSKTLCDSSTGALAGPFPTKFYGAVVWGLGVSGIVSSVMSITIKGSMANDFESVLTQSRIYFGVAMGLQLVSCILLIIMPRNSYAKKYTAEFRNRNAHGEHDGNGAMSKSGNEPPLGTLQEQENGAGKKTKEGEKAYSPSPVEADSEFNGANHVHQNVLTAQGDADKMKDVDQVDNITSTEQMLNAQIKIVFVIVWPMLLSCFVIFGATLLIFPGVFFAVPSNDSWYMTLIAAMFNIGDFLSRSLLLLKCLHPSPKMVMVGSFARLLLIVPLVFCVRGGISGVALPYILCLLWGLTNGYFGGMAMIYGPRAPSLTTAGQRSLAAIMISLALLLGLFVGSSLALAVKEGLPMHEV